ncbi:MAG: serine/threonine protein kinase [Gammaproteobacteria bacterium]
MNADTSHHLRRHLRDHTSRIEATLKPIAHGALARVWKLSSVRSEYSLAMKIMHGRLRGTAMAYEAMEREYRILSALEHPGLPDVTGLVSWHGRAALCYHFIDGESLLSVLARGACSPAQSLDLGIRLMEILIYVHEHPLHIVHSDISPENLIVNERGRLHLIDFGAARTNDDDTRGGGPGKPSYMSPEQAQGRPWTLRSDLYQCGIILFEMLTGKRYNPGATPMARRAFSANPNIDIDNFLDVPWRATMRRLLDPDPAQRWPTARACLSALYRLRDEGILDIKTGTQA